MAAQGATLLALARHAIGQRLGVDGVTPELPDWLDAPGATFVTLTQQGRLRGCIGSLQAYRALHEDVAENAVTAALRDPRFPPLPAQELAFTRIEVSLLSALTALDFDSQADALEQLRPGTDGVVLSYGDRRGTFLPQVWEALPEPEEFLAQLKRKAGLPAGFWDDAIRLERYSVTKWREPVEDADGQA
jgi:AmmeMemoRadiSam system protein A